MAIDKVLQFTQIGDATGVGEARRSALAMARAADLNVTEAGKLAIAVTGAAANVLKHAKGGEILLRGMEPGVEMLAIDKGPGIANLEQAIRDGQSTTGTSGIGLGAISRMASVFDIYTRPGFGTALVAQFPPLDRRREPAALLDPRLEIGAVEVPYPGETECGDAWAASGTSLFMADGLGHGAQAASEAVAAFQDNQRRSPGDAVEAIHRAIRVTRGPAVALAQISPDLHTICFCGLGNINGVIVNGEDSRSMLSHNGTAGHEVRHIAQFEYPWLEGGLLVLHTDGISARWDLKNYPGLMLHHPSLIAAVLYRDFRRKDDSTVVVVKARPPRKEGVV